MLRLTLLDHLVKAQQKVTGVLQQATEYASHRWTVYLRSLDNEDLSHIFSKVSIA